MDVFVLEDRMVDHDHLERPVIHHGFLATAGRKTTLADEMRRLTLSRLSMVVRIADPDSDVYGAARQEWERRRPLRERLAQLAREHTAWATETGGGTEFYQDAIVAARVR